MDPISTALTAAWLDAVRRVQSESVQRFLEQAPQAAPTHDERTLTDVIERVLKNGGAEPTEVEAPEPQQGLHLVDRLV